MVLCDCFILSLTAGVDNDGGPRRLPPKEIASPLETIIPNAIIAVPIISKDKPITEDHFNIASKNVYDTFNNSLRKLTAYTPCKAHTLHLL